MKTYELVIERQQPTCGGRAPTRTEICTVTTDDPVAYVQAIEKFCTLEVTEKDDGALLITTERGGLWIKYEFTED